MVITDPRGKKLETLKNELEMRHHFAAFTGGNYQICVQNTNGKIEQTFDFLLQTGVQALDYSAIVTKKHLRPVELQAQKVLDNIQQLRNELSMLIVSEEGLKEENQKIKTRVVIFGIISIIVMMISTYVQITYLKNFFRYKKII